MNQSISDCSAAADRDMIARMMIRSDEAAATSGNARGDVNGGPVDDQMITIDGNTLSAKWTSRRKHKRGQRDRDGRNLAASAMTVKRQQRRHELTRCWQDASGSVGIHSHSFGHARE